MSAIKPPPQLYLGLDNPWDYDLRQNEDGQIINYGLKIKDATATASVRYIPSLISDCGVACTCDIKGVCIETETWMIHGPGVIMDDLISEPALETKGIWLESELVGYVNPSFRSRLWEIIRERGIIKASF